MGFSYQIQGGRKLLVCEGCSEVGGVRKVKCPAGWCQASALCAACRKSPEIKAKLAASHATCAESAAFFAAREAAEEAALAAGEGVFCAAAGSGSEVEMTFKYASGMRLAVFVTTEVYEAARALGAVVTESMVEGLLLAAAA